MPGEDSPEAIASSKRRRLEKMADIRETQNTDMQLGQDRNLELQQGQNLAQQQGCKLEKQPLQQEHEHSQKDLLQQEQEQQQSFREQQPQLIRSIDSHMSGRAFYESIGSPKFILAPMVDQSDLAWRLLCLKNGADACYSPMMHARLFSTNAKYRKRSFATNAQDKPLTVQFCANDPQILLNAAQLVQSKCAAIDLNLGCPQGIARKGHYGAFLQDEWDLVCSIISYVRDKFALPITAKIRIFPHRNRTLEYARRLVDAGASILCVHGRTREQKGVLTGPADWRHIRFLRENLPENVVIFANGNIFNHSDLEHCLEVTGVDGVLTAEGALYNPHIFRRGEQENWKQQHPMLDELLDEYITIIRANGLEEDASTLAAIKSHFFKVLHPILERHPEIRELLARSRSTSLQPYVEIKDAVAACITNLRRDSIIGGETDVLGSDLHPLSKYQSVPYWRAQCYIRRKHGPVQTEATADGSVTAFFNNDTTGNEPVMAEATISADNDVLDPNAVHEG